MAEAGGREAEAVVDLLSIAAQGVQPVGGELLPTHGGAGGRGVSVRLALLALILALLHLHGLPELPLVHDEHEAAVHIPRLPWVDHVPPHPARSLLLARSVEPGADVIDRSVNKTGVEDLVLDEESVPETPVWYDALRIIRREDAEVGLGLARRHIALSKPHGEK